MSSAVRACLFAAVLLAFAPASWSDEDSAIAAERTRISAERATAEASFKSEEKACYRKFSVTSCVEAARERRRTVMTDLRRQEVSINDAERKRRGADRLRDIEDRRTNETEAKEALKREKAAADTEVRAERGAKKASDRAALAASAPSHEAARKAGEQQKQQSKATSQAERVKAAADNVKQREAKAAEAEANRKQRDKKIADRKKPAAAPLPTPP